MLWKMRSYFIQNHHLFLKCFFAYKVLRFKHSHNLHHLQFACAYQILMINEAADNEMNNDVDVHEIWWYEVSELMIFQQTLFKFKHIRCSFLLTNIDVSINDMIILTWERYCIWLSLKICLNIKWNDVQFVIVTKMIILLCSSIDMLTWKRYCIWLFLLSNSYAETCFALLINASKLSHDDDEW